MLTVELNTIEDLETLPVKIIYVAETVGKFGVPGYVMDEWRVTITSGKVTSNFGYFTGVGHRTRAYSPTGNKWDKTKRKHYADKRVTPKIASVLHSLASDSNAVNESFTVWCENYGYSSDSISAFDDYRACLKTGEALHKHFSRETLNRIGELLQDY